MAVPSITIIVPTYNSAHTLSQCLASIQDQAYPRHKVEVIVADGGSSDSTLEVASRFHVDKILHNTLRTGEAGKAVGVKAAGGEIIALVDSDNILPSSDWLMRMVEPFADETIAGAEPLYYTYRKKDPLITRYCALLGMNDPICLYVGNYDRFSYVTQKWTGLDVKYRDRGRYLELSLDGSNIPTIGANGFLIRRDVINKVHLNHYLFDIDLIHELVLKEERKFAKVKVGIVHLFADGPRMFMQKTLRRIRDYRFHNGLRVRLYPWWHLGRLRILRFVAFTPLMFPIARDTVRGYRAKPDRAWLFHPFACWLVLVIYGYFSVLTVGPKPINLSLPPNPSFR